MAIRELLRKVWRPHRDSNPGFSLERAAGDAGNPRDLGSPGTATWHFRLSGAPVYSTDGMHVTAGGRAHLVRTERDLAQLVERLQSCDGARA